MIICFAIIAICIIFCVFGILTAILQGITDGLRKGIVDIGNQMIDETINNHKRNRKNRKL